MRKKKTTIYDIAKEVGTSAATVSRVLSNSGYPVNSSLRQKILDTAKDLNYSPNIIGRMLKTNVSRDIGVIIPNISNPFYPQLLLGIELEARKEGYNIFLCNSLRDPATEKRYIETLLQKQISGLIISSYDENNRYLKELYSNDVKIVVLDRVDEDRLHMSVGFDYRKGGIMAVNHLISMGHRNIAFLTSPVTKNSRRETLEGYRLGLIQNQIDVCEDNVIISDIEEEVLLGIYEFENGRKLADKFMKLKTKPTAIFAINDMTALGIMQKLIESGIKVPKDVSVIGFDNIEISSMVNPPLSTINQPSFETGRLACKMLIDSIGSSTKSSIAIKLDPSLVIRSSVSNIL